MSNDKQFDLQNITYVKLITMGNIDPNNRFYEREKAFNLLNRCLSSSPRGRIIAIDKEIATFFFGEHQAIAEMVTYHIGFERKPSWLND